MNRNPASTVSRMNVVTFSSPRAKSTIAGVISWTAISRPAPNSSTNGTIARARGSIAGVSALITGVSAFSSIPMTGPAALKISSKGLDEFFEYRRTLEQLEDFHNELLEYRRARAQARAPADHPARATGATAQPAAHPTHGSASPSRLHFNPAQPLGYIRDIKVGGQIANAR